MTYAGFADFAEAANSSDELADHGLNRKPDTHCFTPGCRTGYPGHPVENGRKILLFLVPKEEERRKDWEYNLKRKEKPLAETIVVCEKHFAEHLVIRDYVYVIGGNEVRISRGRPALAAGAVPTLLPDLPAYLSKVLLKPRLERKRRGVFSSESAKKVRLSRRDEQEASLPEDQNVDPNARAFENDERLDHLLLECSAGEASRQVMLAVYGQLGLPRETSKHLLKRKGRGRKSTKSSEPLVDSDERCVDAPRPFSDGATERVASDDDDVHELRCIITICTATLLRRCRGARLVLIACSQNFCIAMSATLPSTMLSSLTIQVEFLSRKAAAPTETSLTTGRCVPWQHCFRSLKGTTSTTWMRQFCCTICLPQKHFIPRTPVSRGESSPRREYPFCLA
ncbi:hypothetical protein HPB51_026577 [Rhipicephalus microplus]|uniref:THAP-type domain-containing protein n=1 Tax=Rhipicephalus microplus TaxID=6941 RepID=A0A9J6D2P7_RHIMP|nr:hypothetical protein HPB51_026577 [Rhipicephalus microplus]